MGFVKQHKKAEKFNYPHDPLHNWVQFIKLLDVFIHFFLSFWKVLTINEQINEFFLKKKKSFADLDKKRGNYFERLFFF